ncbi:hypothetical protein [Rhodopirellula europaea]|uniref:hypothetical protein n=1 Tax=Rhodopirellula europaea TaxID=1263866 RepID=UPI003D2A7468
MKLSRPTFAISTLLLLTMVSAIAIAIKSYPARRIAKTRATYDAQKQVVDAVTRTYVADLTKAGYSVVDDSTGVGGSGEWRQYVAIAATSPQGHQDVCYVEVMGFVSHDEVDQPTWMEVLPMKISHKQRKLNDAFLTLLLGELEGRDWAYAVDNRCRGDGWFSNNPSEFYLAVE